MRSRARVFFALLLAVAAAGPPVDAQQAPKIAKIGFLSAGTQTSVAHLVEAFRQGLRELGYVEGKTLVLELRYGEGKGERLPELARELLGLKVDVIVAPNDVAIDWTADWLHRECELILDDWARSEHGRPYADLGPEPHAALRELQDVATDAIE